MATRKASGNQGQVKDPEHDGRLKGHHGGEAPKAHAEGTHENGETHSEPKAEKKHEAEASGHAKGGEGRRLSPAPPRPKAHRESAHSEGPKKAETKALAIYDEADLKSREYTDAEGNVHHHTKKYMEQHES